jgi:hypothetical protein
MIEADGLTKRYGSTLAVDNLSFQVKPGVVTGFLGPNGAGKSTTMRMVLGLDRPTSGRVTIGGRSYADLTNPLRTIGALLDARWVHPNRSARDHLRWMAAAARLPERRVDEVLDLVGLTSVASKRANTSPTRSSSGGSASSTTQPAASSAAPACSSGRRSSGASGAPGKRVTSAARRSRAGPSSGASTERGSSGLRPASTWRSRRRSATERASGPTASMAWAAMP